MCEMYLFAKKTETPDPNDRPYSKIEEGGICKTSVKYVKAALNTKV